MSYTFDSYHMEQLGLKSAQATGAVVGNSAVGTGAAPKKKVKYAMTCSLILIPTRQEYVDADIDLWYGRFSFEQAKLQASYEIKSFMSANPHVTFQRAVAALYQPDSTETLHGQASNSTAPEAYYSPPLTSHDLSPMRVGSNTSFSNTTHKGNSRDERATESSVWSDKGSSDESEMDVGQSLMGGGGGGENESLFMRDSPVPQMESKRAGSEEPETDGDDISPSGSIHDLSNRNQSPCYERGTMRSTPNRGSFSSSKDSESTGSEGSSDGESADSGEHTWVNRHHVFGNGGASDESISL